MTDAELLAFFDEPRSLNEVSAVAGRARRERGLTDIDGLIQRFGHCIYRKLRAAGHDHDHALEVSVAVSVDAFYAYSETTVQ